MRKKLILIDSSLKGPGGHYFEYDKRVLDAANRLGYDTVTLAHSDYSGDHSYEVLPTFSKDYWDNFRFYNKRYFGGAPVAPKLSILFTKAKRVGSYLYRRIVFSKIGLAIERIKGRDFFLLLTGPKAFVETKSLIDSNRSQLLVAWFLRAGWDVYEHVFLRPHGAHLKKYFFGVLAIIFLPIIMLSIIPYSLLRIGLLIRENRKKTPPIAFCKELEKALLTIDVDENTIFFVPNATTAEIEALIYLRQKKSEVMKCRWALLFRRPFFTGYPSTYAGQVNDLIGFRNDMGRLAVLCPDIKVTFFTDTHELSDQYNYIGIYKFYTLPVPVDVVDDVAVKDSHQKYIVSYLGDAREEKGFHYLKSIVECINGNNSLSKSVEFLFQSNFNFPGGDELSRHAKHDLENLVFENVSLIEGPVDSEVYSKYLDMSSMLVMPYSPADYFARSSGVFMEALSRGLPVVVPAGSWMSNVVEHHRRSVIDEQLRNNSPLQSIVLTQDMTSSGVLENVSGSNYFSLDFGFLSDIKNPVRIRIKLYNKFDIEIYRTQMSYLPIDSQVLSLFEIPPSEKLAWEVEILGDVIHPKFSFMKASLYYSDAGLHIDSGVIMYDGPEQLPKAVCSGLLEYERHKKAMELLSVEHRHRYDPDNLIGILDSAISAA
ncbi:hypothetical protein GCM10011316_36650 [Roseibium aquae]|uniref:Glycosyltransferase involved in cell wall biosynthesis n=1 Tax=Roseibium aquae TaxID=1323746 RepID=A0A916TNG9_9HYPH|nr:glycosyltransferase [Roseibium aquae]GGB61327.1 hypothetical protein GCM10011316_36650 [Roseibium aquae]